MPRHRIWRAEHTHNGFTIHVEIRDPQKVALLGVRPCELRAIEIQDEMFIGSDCVDPDYAARRANAFIIAVNCGSAGDTCFCVSMGSGPRADHGFDLALTELLNCDRHAFLIEAGSEAGVEMARALPLDPASGRCEQAIRNHDPCISCATHFLKLDLDRDGR